MGKRGGPERAAVLRRFWLAIESLSSRYGLVGPYTHEGQLEKSRPHITTLKSRPYIYLLPHLLAGFGRGLEHRWDRHILKRVHDDIRPAGGDHIAGRSQHTNHDVLHARHRHDRTIDREREILVDRDAKGSCRNALVDLFRLTRKHRIGTIVHGELQRRDGNRAKPLG